MNIYREESLVVWLWLNVSDKVDEDNKKIKIESALSFARFLSSFNNPTKCLKPCFGKG